MNAPPQRRLHELDSLRGLAAFTVVVHHFSLMWPAWLALLQNAHVGAFHIDLLYPFVAGREAVMLFFVLSGLVLTLPYLRGRNQPYPIFLARRILRIYFPYLGALALGICGAAIWHGDLHHGAFTELFWSKPVELKLVLQHIAFLGVYQWQQFDFVIWSLIVEMRISVIFPALLLITLKVRSKVAILIAAALTCLAFVVTRHASPYGARMSLMMTVHYIAFFILGILVARHLAPLSEKYLSQSRTARVLVLLASFGLYYFSYLMIRELPHAWVGFGADWCIVLGAIGFIVVGLNEPAARRLLNHSVSTFLGRISYSLYLVHGPVLLAITFALGKSMSIWAQFSIYVVASLVLAYFFCIWIEEPCTRLGQRLSRRKPVTLAPASTVGVAVALDAGVAGLSGSSI